MRRTAVILTTAVLAVALYVANVSWWLETEVLDTAQFVDTSLEAMEVETTRDAAAEIIVDRLADEFPLLRVVDSALVSLFSDLLVRDVIQPLIVTTATDVHQRLIEGDQSALLVDLQSYRELLLAPVEALSPELAARVPKDWFESVEVFKAGALPDLSAYHDRTEAVAVFSTLLGAALAVILLAVTRQWFRGLMAIGISFLLAGGFSAVLVPGGRSASGAFIDDEASAALAAGMYDAFTRSLLTRSLAMLAAGGLLFAVGLVGLLIVRDRGAAPAR